MDTRMTMIALVLAVLGGTAIPAPANTGDGTVLSSVEGGLMYDKWWVYLNLPEPTGDHPLYPAGGQQSGSTTWRCKECHGWDYKGVDGAYGSGSHFTGIKGVFGSTLTSEEMFDLIKLDTPPNGHGFGDAGMTDDDICKIVDFLQDSLIDTDSYISGSDFIGDEVDGRFAYARVGGYYTCARCHGDDGTAINFGTPGDPEYIADLAAANPWEVLHKMRVGHPGSTMTSWMLLGESDQSAADIGRYAQLDFPPPAYVGDQTCSGCHANMPYPGFFAAYRDSGHPYKLFRSAGAEPPAGTWPHTPTPPLPVANGVQLQWSDIEYVIGNYFWKARFVDHDGYIYTGLSNETTQWNLATQEFVPYHAGETDKPYNCGKCHTTGYQPEGNQLGLPGLIGTWTEEGVRCEACHGPAGDHVGNPINVVPPGGKLCRDCHFRDTQFRMPWKSGFMRHHQQSEDFSHSPHTTALTCNTCHNPHRSTVYDDGGMIAQCASCHPGNAANGFYHIAGMETVECKDCHMPYMAKSAVAFNPYMGDVRGHLFQITTEPLMAADNTYADGTNLYWDEPVVTLDYACMGCHEDIGDPITIEAASAFAFHIHTAHPAGANGTCEGDTNNDGEVDVNDLNNVFLDWDTDGSANGGDLTGPIPGSPPDGIVNVNDLNSVFVNWGICFPIE